MIYALVNVPNVAFSLPTAPCSNQKGHNIMKYMLQIRWGGAEVAISKLSADEQQRVFAEFEAILNSPGILDANQLQPAATASTVTVENEHTNVAEGPAVDAGLALDGYYLYDAADRDAAIGLASRIPAARLGATVEVRPVVER